jgi:superoxide dismutase, Cu-Zn family
LAKEGGEMSFELSIDSAKITARAKAVVAGPSIEGQAEFTEYDVDGWKYVLVLLKLKGDPKVLTPGRHAVHVHEKGDCECEGFKCAGGHFDPGPNGNSDPDANHGYHAGDLPNITIDDSGQGILKAVTSRLSLSAGPVSILDKGSAPEGTALMVHAQEDPHTPGESGSGHSGGPRLACGKIVAA